MFEGFQTYRKTKRVFAFVVLEVVVRRIEVSWEIKKMEWILHDEYLQED